MSPAPEPAPSINSAPPPHKRSAWEWAGLIGVVALAAGLRLWNLKQNGYCNLYFSAGVRSMMQSWHNFFYASFDPGGFLTIDKPPVAYWIQTLSCKLVGFNAYGLLLPQVLAGTAAIVLLYDAVRRTFGAGAGLLAAVVLAVTPISVAMDRHNNADSIMVFFLVLGAWAVLRAGRTGRLRWLLLGMTAAGVAFNTKMLLACVALPAFYVAYFLGTRISWKARLGHLLAASAVLVAVGLSWPLAFDLTPADQRPYVGSTKDNSMLSLTIGWNGMARITGKGRHIGFGDRRGPRGPQERPFRMASTGTENARRSNRPPNNESADKPDFGPPGRPGGGMFGIGSPGPLRFKTRSLATQIAWVWPLALAGALIVATRHRLRWPLGDEHQQLLLWTAWALTMAAVFSYAKGITHSYYTLQMGPPLAALTGITISSLWAEVKRGAWRGWFFPAVLIGQATWTAYLLRDYTSWARILVPVLWWGIGVGVLLVVLGQAAHRFKLFTRFATAGLIAACLAVLAGPAAWSVTPCLTVASATQPAAGPGVLRGMRGPMDFDHALESAEPLIAYLRKHRESEKWLVATLNTTEAAPLIVASGEPVMAIGGWQGAEPAISDEQLRAAFKCQKLRYVLLSSFGPMGGNAERFSWIRENATPIPRKRWHATNSNDVSMGPMGGPPGRGGFGRGPGGFAPGGFGRGGFGPGAGFGGSGLYDCRGAF